MRILLGLVCLTALLAGCTPAKPHVITKTDFSQSPYCVFLLVDGLGPDMLGHALKGGDIPNIKTHVIDRGIMAENMISIYPSVTAAAIPSILTGLYPGHHQSPNFQWVDRKTREYRSYIGGDIAKMEADLYDHAKTIFQFLPEEESASFGLIYGRQAGKDDSLIFSALNPFHRNAPLSHVVLSDLFAKIGLGKGVPHFLAFYEWGVDAQGHLSGVYSPGLRDVMQKVDRQFGDIVKAYQDRGLYDDTYFVLASDHGLAPMKEYFFIDQALNNAGFCRKLISYNLGEGFFPESWARADSVWFKHENVTPYNAVIGSSGGGAATLDFVLNEGRDEEGRPTAKSWALHPIYEDLRHYRLGQGPTVKQSPVDVIRFLQSMEPVEFFFLRENRPKPGETSKVLVIGKDGMGRAARKASADGKGYFYAYEVAQGKDPLRYDADGRVRALMRRGFHDKYVWREATAHHEHPEFPVLATHIFDTDRSGTVHVSMKNGWGINSKVSAKHAGYNREEMLAVFCMAGPGLSKGWFHTASIVDITPTILALLLRDGFDGDYFDGRPIPEVMDMVNK